MNYDSPSKGKGRERPFDYRIGALTSDHRNSWNIYHTLANIRENRSVPLDERMLPRRTADYLMATTFQQQEAFEKIATDNRVLYEQYLLRNTRTRIPLLVSFIDHYQFLFFYWALVKKKDSRTLR